jgi:hypothetical protein
MKYVTFKNISGHGQEQGQEHEIRHTHSLFYLKDPAVKLDVDSVKAECDQDSHVACHILYFFTSIESRGQT